LPRSADECGPSGARHTVPHVPKAAPSVADIAVITDDWSHPLLNVEPPAGERGVELMPDLWLEQLPHAEAEACIEACQERGLNFDGGKRQFRQLYSFARRNAPEGALFTFDSDQMVETALQLSRLIVLNSHCTEWAVRVLRDYFPAAQNPQLVPARCSRRFFAFHVLTGERDWLTQDDAEALGRLLRRHAEVKDDLPERVTNGMWMAEWGARVPYFQPALVNTVTCLEALLKTDRPKLKAQFVARTCALAEELEVDGITVEAADALYEARSDTVHGGFVRIEKDSPEALRLVVFQKLLMKSLRRAIEDSVFCERFRSADAVRDFWPVG
jgi:hypothetical protein